MMLLSYGKDPVISCPGELCSVLDMDLLNSLDGLLLLTDIVYIDGIKLLVKKVNDIPFQKVNKPYIFLFSTNSNGTDFLVDTYDYLLSSNEKMINILRNLSIPILVESQIDIIPNLLTLSHFLLHRKPETNVGFTIYVEDEKVLSVRNNGYIHIYDDSILNDSNLIGLIYLLSSLLSHEYRDNDCENSSKILSYGGRRVYLCNDFYTGVKLEYREVIDIMSKVFRGIMFERYKRKKHDVLGYGDTQTIIIMDAYSSEVISKIGTFDEDTYKKLINVRDLLTKIPDIKGNVSD